MAASKLPLRWTSHVREAGKKKAFEDSLRASSTCLNRLATILQEDLEALDYQENSFKDFEDPNWPFKQAFRNGQKAQLQKIKDLISFN